MELLLCARDVFPPVYQRVLRGPERVRVCAGGATDDRATRTRQPGAPLGGAYVLVRLVI